MTKFSPAKFKQALKGVDSDREGDRVAGVNQAMMQAKNAGMTFMAAVETVFGGEGDGKEAAVLQAQLRRANEEVERAQAEIATLKQQPQQQSFDFDGSGETFLRALLHEQKFYVFAITGLVAARMWFLEAFQQRPYVEEELFRNPGGILGVWIAVAAVVALLLWSWCEALYEKRGIAVAAIKGGCMLVGLFCSMSYYFGTSSVQFWAIDHHNRPTAYFMLLLTTMMCGTNIVELTFGKLRTLETVRTFLS